MKFPNKLPAEKWKCGISFANQLASGDALSSAAYESVAGSLTVTAVSVVGSSISFTVEGGAAGETCELVIKGTTSLGEVLAETATFKILS